MSIKEDLCNFIKRKKMLKLILMVLIISSNFLILFQSIAFFDSGSSLKLHLKFDETPTSGTTVLDSSEYENHGSGYGT